MQRPESYIINIMLAIKSLWKIYIPVILALDMNIRPMHIYAYVTTDVLTKHERQIVTITLF